MQVGGGTGRLLWSGITVPSPSGSLAWKLQRLYAEAFAIEKKLHRVATRVAEHRNDLAFLALPVPVGEQVQHQIGRPLALVEVIIVFRKSAGVEHTAGRKFAGPTRFAQIINPSPPKVADDIVMYFNKLPKLLRANHGHRVAGRPFHSCPARTTGSAETAWPAKTTSKRVVTAAADHRTFRSNHLALRKGVAVIVVDCLAPRAPAVRVIVADDVEQVQEIQCRTCTVG